VVKSDRTPHKNITMAINIPRLVKDLLAETKNALLDLVTNDAPRVVEAVDSYIANAEGRLTALMTSVAEGSTIDFLLARLSEEKDILESEVLSFVVIGKGIAENVINKVQDIIINAIANVLPGNKIA
jgi:hypothetical protein